MGLTLGLGGLKRHACAALFDDGRLLGVCEQERITRQRAAGVNGSGLPDEAVDFMLSRLGRSRNDVHQIALAEPSEAVLAGEVARYDHHLGHAAAAYLTSPFTRAAVIVCDHQDPGVSVWEGADGRLERKECGWASPGLASLYSACADALGFSGETQAARLEALARLRPDASLDDCGRQLEPLRRLDSGVRECETALGAVNLPGLVACGRLADAATVAGAVQNRIGDLLLDLLAATRRTTRARQLCLGGSLFYNSSYCTRVKTSGHFDRVFVPVDPGNAGLAAGSALLARGAAPAAVSPFLGPKFDSEEVKATLDNCKLTYEWMNPQRAVERAVDALVRGRLVGWFEGPMEAGPRALGARSILANPFSPYVLENLNRFLKHRQPWRGYALSVRREELLDVFDDPVDAPFMECDFQPRDRDRFRHVLPLSSAAIRVQTVGDGVPHDFLQVLQLFGQAAGASVLVNTSFNGFSEPIVCSPRDAIRVFYGTGLDLLVVNGFVLAK
jgi:carbamoyltransferase